MDHLLDMLAVLAAGECGEMGAGVKLRKVGGPQLNK